MKFHRLELINKDQSGLSFIELLIATAITTLVVAAVTTTIFQIVIGNTRSNNHITAVRQVQSAGYWVSHDAQMSANTSTNTFAPTGFPLTLKWAEWDNSGESEVTYSLGNMPNSGFKQFERQYITYDATGYVTGNTTSIIARFIDDSDPALTSCNFSDNVLTMKITATVGSDSQQKSETRVYEVKPRPDS